jgi:hypothetical protein
MRFSRVKSNQLILQKNWNFFLPNFRYHKIENKNKPLLTLSAQKGLGKQI